MDPRIDSPMSDLVEQLALEQRLADLMTEGTRAIRSARSLRDRITKELKEAKGRRRRRLDAFDGRLKSLLEGTTLDDEHQPMTGLVAAQRRVSSLYGAIGSADVAPTPAQRVAAEQAEHDLKEALARWRALAADSNLPRDSTAGVR
jgi:hypothetical protein